MCKCTIAVPTYNREDNIGDAIESALLQDIPNLEILVIDDQSVDNTFKVIQSYSDPRLRIVRNDTNIGLFGNFNRCLELATGQYIKILCDDDKLVPGCIRREVDVMDANHNVALLFSKGQRMGSSGRIIGPVGNHFHQGIYAGIDAIHAVLWFKAHYAINPITLPSGVLLRKEAVRKAGWFDTSMKMEGDIDFWLRVLKYGDMAVLETYGCEIKFHPRQVSNRLLGDIDVTREAFTITEKYSQLLMERGSYNRIRQQLVAYSLGMAYKLWRVGLYKESRKHWDFARTSNVNLATASLAVVRLVSLRLLMKIIGVRLVPMRLLREI